MKYHFTKNLLTLVLALLCLGSTNAQSKLAQLKFQDAEELFAKDDFAGALLKLEDAEKLTGKTNPPMLYLRIQSLNGLFLADPYANYKILESLRKNTTTFLKEFENVKGIDDKYRDVYKIGESLASYPKDYESFTATKNESKSKKDDANLKIEVTNKNYNDAFATYNYFEEYQMGISLDELKSQNKKFFRKTGEFDLPDRLGVKGKTLYSKTMYDYSEMNSRYLTSFVIINNKLCGYLGTVRNIYEGEPFSQTISLTEKMVNENNKNFGFKAEEKPIEAGKSNTRGTVYTWKKNGKIIELTSSQTPEKKYSLGMIYIIAIDEALANK